MPHTRAALTAGIIDEAAAAAVVHQTSPLSDEHRAAVDELLAPRFAGATAREIGTLAARHAAELDPASIVAKHRKAVSERGVWTRPAPDGMAYLSVFGPLPDVVGALASLRGYANGVLGGHHEEDDPPAERTHAQIMADTALRLLSGRTAGQTQPVHIGLLMRPESLFGHAQDDPDRCVDRPAWVVGHGPLPAALARRLLLRGCDAADDSSDAGHQNSDDLTPDDLTPADARPADPMPGEPAHTLIQRIFTSPDGRDLVGLESSARLFPPALRWALIIRDDVCRTPYCGAVIRHADHVSPFARSRTTSLANGQGLCARCNYTKDLPGFSTRVLTPQKVTEYAHGHPDDPNTGIAQRAGLNTHVTEIRTPSAHRYLSCAHLWPAADLACASEQRAGSLRGRGGRGRGAERLGAAAAGSSDAPAIPR
ncbi:MAG: HNH endonuclease [Actinobacteria bacterium]|nr:HNH endonuclease [Actinomycetota bacterium]